MERFEWSVMGTVAAIQAKESGSLSVSSATSLGDSLQNISDEVRGVFTEIESLLNAHNAKSELRRLAPLSDREVEESCNERVRRCYEAAFALQKASGGAFNPRWRGSKTLDLGAIAKGFAVDLATERVHAPKGVSVLVDLGGNLKAAKGSWRTGVKNPSGSGIAASVELKEGEALATSAKYFRGEHIYDGRTGKPVDNGVASVTVLCRSAMAADGLSTVLFIFGPDDGRKFLERHLSEFVGEGGAEVLWILSDGSRLTYPLTTTRFK